MAKILDMSRLVDDIADALDKPAVQQVKALKKVEKIVNKIDHEYAPQLEAGIKEIERIEAESAAAKASILADMIRKVQGLSGDAEQVGGDIEAGIQAVLQTTDTLGRVGTILANLNFLMDSEPQLGVDLLRGLLDVEPRLDYALTHLTFKELNILLARIVREKTRKQTEQKGAAK